MGTEESKIQHSKRRHNTTVKALQQQTIAELHGVKVTSPMVYAKHHAMDCGIPECKLCGNPRNLGEETKQEKSNREFWNEVIGDELS